MIIETSKTAVGVEAMKRLKDVLNGHTFTPLQQSVLVARMDELGASFEHSVTACSTPLGNQPKEPAPREFIYRKTPDEEALEAEQKDRKFGTPGP
jgi:hypothetical protein